MKTSSCLTTLLLTVPSVSGFIFSNARNLPKADLTKITDSQIGKELNVGLEVVNLEDLTSKMSINGISLKFSSDACKRHPKMPGPGTPEASICSAVRSMDIKEGHYVDMTGSKKARMENGCWEMAWREGERSGALICGLELPEAIKRNTAKLAKGPLYLNFSVWTKEGWATVQKEKIMVTNRAKEYKKDQQKALQKYYATNNILEKAMHYKEALYQAELYFYSGIHEYNKLPDSQEVVDFDKDHVILKKGVVWTMIPKMFGAMNNVVVGSVNVQPSFSSKLRP